MRLDSDELLRRARQLRADQTDAEAKLWGVLRNRRLGRWRWKRQVPHPPYVLDFYCPEAQLVVELDGGQHAEQEAYDARRTAQLENDGLRVIRFWNVDIFEAMDGVCDTVLAACGGERTSPSPRGAERSPRPRGAGERKGPARRSRVGG